MDNKLTSPAVKGSLIALVLIVVAIVAYYSGQISNPVFRYLVFGLYTGAVIISCIYYSKQLQGNVTFGNVFAEGFKTSAATTALFMVFTFIALKSMPGIVTIVLDEAGKGMREQKTMTPLEIDQSIAMMKEKFVPFTMSMGLVTYLFVGLIASLIGAVVAKKNK